MELWQSILIAFGGNAALLAALAFLTKLIVAELLKRNSFEHQIIFTKLHEKRADAILAIHNGLINYIAECKRFINQAEHLDEGVRDEMLTSLNKSSSEIRNTIACNKIYLSKALLNKIEDAFKKSQIPTYEFIFHLGSFEGGNISKSEYVKKWEVAYLQFKNNIPSVLNELESEFRNILGVKD
jgi:hypothetical protein